jgi:hypothetical protein
MAGKFPLSRRECQPLSCSAGFYLQSIYTIILFNDLHAVKKNHPNCIMQNHSSTSSTVLRSTNSQCFPALWRGKDYWDYLLQWKEQPTINCLKCNGHTRWLHKKHRVFFSKKGGWDPRPSASKRCIRHAVSVYSPREGGVCPARYHCTAAISSI